MNDDRTTLLKNDYNREILATLSDMFVDLLPQVRQPADPAAHLDYMPARGREPLSFGDKLLCAHVPEIAASVDMVPDTTGTLVNSGVLRPLDFAVQVHPDVHRASSQRVTGHLREFYDQLKPFRREPTAVAFESRLRETLPHQVSGSPRP